VAVRHEHRYDMPIKKKLGNATVPSENSNSQANESSRCRTKVRAKVHANPIVAVCHESLTSRAVRIKRRAAGCRRRGR